MSLARWPPPRRRRLAPQPLAFPPLPRRALSRRWYPGRGSIPVFRDDSRQKSSRTPRSNAWRVAGLANAPLKQSAGGEPIEKLAVPRTGHGDEASDRCASPIADVAHQPVVMAAGPRAALPDAAGRPRHVDDPDLDPALFHDLARDGLARGLAELD